ncbi:MAG: sugar ABC transporter substrate-binding protein [Chloroflexi bacterium]|nr:sugar ABC transporter substrate-binding protein [Chloroflexota bacterium]MCC6891674.1 sugar ABC transporter substrate-binding protein [Anaerolineae bacterium]
MNVKSKLAVAAVFAALAVTPVTSIFASSKSDARSVAAQDACPTKKDSYKIGFANLTTGVDFITAVEAGMVSAAGAAGNIELVIANNNLDGATALNNAENFVAQGVDGVVEFQTDEKFGNVIMNLFQNTEPPIPVIAIDIPMPGATFFGADNYKAGLMAGEAGGDYANENWGGKVDYILVLELPQSGPIPAARMQGQVDGIQGKLETPVPEENIIRLDSKNTQDVAFKVVSDALPLIPEDANIIAVQINDDTAQGTAAALEAAGRTEHSIIVGQGAVESGLTEMLKENSLYLGATAYFPELYGSKIIPAMIDLLECRAVPPAIYVDHQFVTKENICEVLPDSKACATLGGASTEEATPEATAAS